MEFIPTWDLLREAWFKDKVFSGPSEKFDAEQEWDQFVKGWETDRGDLQTIREAYKNLGARYTKDRGERARAESRERDLRAAVEDAHRMLDNRLWALARDRLRAALAAHPEPDASPPVHNHGPSEGRGTFCPERRTADGQPRGACLDSLDDEPRYRVTRNDGRDAEGEKHHGCRYFVLDLTHDPKAAGLAAVYFDAPTPPALTVTREQVVRARLVLGSNSMTNENAVRLLRVLRVRVVDAPEVADDEGDIPTDSGLGYWYKAPEADRGRPTMKECQKEAGFTW